MRQRRHILHRYRHYPYLAFAAHDRREPTWGEWLLQAALIMVGGFGLVILATLLVWVWGNLPR